MEVKTTEKDLELSTSTSEITPVKTSTVSTEATAT